MLLSFVIRLRVTDVQAVQQPLTRPCAIEILLDCALIHVQRSGTGRDAGVDNAVYDDLLAQLVAAGLFGEVAARYDPEVPRTAIFLALVDVLDEVVRLVALDEVQGNETVEPVGKASDVNERLAFFERDLRLRLPKVRLAGSQERSIFPDGEDIERAFAEADTALGIGVVCASHQLPSSGLKYCSMF